MSVTPLHAARPARHAEAVGPTASGGAPILAPDDRPLRNPGTALDLALVRSTRINRSAVERRVATLPARRTVKKEWQAAWLLRVITCMDLTTLSGDDTVGNVRRLCAKARHPLRQDIVTALGVADLALTVGAVCVYHEYVATAVDALDGSGIPVAAVSTGFPAGLSPFEQRLAEVRASVAAGASEIDIVITRSHVLRGDWQALFDEVRAFLYVDITWNSPFELPVDKQLAIAGVIAGCRSPNREPRRCTLQRKVQALGPAANLHRLF